MASLGPLLLSLFPRSGFTLGRLPLDSGLEVNFSVSLSQIYAAQPDISRAFQTREFIPLPRLLAMVMVTTAPLVCNKIMFTQALNVSGDPASRPSRSPPGHAGHSAENTGLCVLGLLLSALPRFSMCPLAWGRGAGAQGTYLPFSSTERAAGSWVALGLCR